MVIFAATESPSDTRAVLEILSNSLFESIPKPAALVMTVPYSLQLMAIENQKDARAIKRTEHFLEEFCCMGVFISVK